MVFWQILLEFGVNFIFAAVLVLINSGLVFLAANILKTRENTFLKALACSIYIGLVLLLSAYVRNMLITAVLFIGMIPAMKFVYEQEWKDKNLYLFWSFWLVLIMAFFLLAFGILRILA